MTGHQSGQSKRAWRLAEIQRLRATPSTADQDASLMALEDREGRVQQRYSRIVTRHRDADAETASRLQCVSILESLVDELRVGRLPVPQEAQKALAALCCLLGKGALPGASLVFRERIIFSHNGDASVGLEGERAEMLVDTSGFSPDDAAERVAAIRNGVGEALSKVWDYPVLSVTDRELYERQAMGKGASQIRKLNDAGYSVKGLIGKNGNFRWFIVKHGDGQPSSFSGNEEGWSSYGEAVNGGIGHLAAPSAPAKPKTKGFELF